MSSADVLVIGAGPAGLAAVSELARLGLRSVMVEQRNDVGGAIYRKQVGNGAYAQLWPEHHRRRREALMHDYAQAQASVTPLFSSVFIGVDRDGRYLVDDRHGGCVHSLRPRAVIVAVGTVERIQPREGWELPGVVSAGGMQVQLKETGCTPKGPILLAGNGPLLLALAAQLAAAGNPPLALLERSQPLSAAWWQGSAVFNALRSWPHVQEAALYAHALWKARVPFLTGWKVQSIQAANQGLTVHAQHASGLTRRYLVQHLALHDGLTPNTTGMPPSNHAADPFTVYAGDCRTVLGAGAAVDDGCRAARLVAQHLGQRCDTATLDALLAQALRTQDALGQLYRCAPETPTAHTVVCRCEGLRRRDFDHLKVAGSAHELRLVGRFGMGMCQGRFCAHTVSQLAQERGVHFEPAALQGDVPRWPLRPVSLAALAAYSEPPSPPVV